MKVEHTLASGPFMEVVHVLGDDVHVKHLLQPGQSTVSFVGLGRDNLPTSLVVEFQHQARIGIEAFGRGHLLHPVAFPQPVCTPERGDARLRAHASASEDHEFGLLFCHAGKLRAKPGPGPPYLAADERKAIHRVRPGSHLLAESETAKSGNH